jgi:hypothetical protein
MTPPDPVAQGGGGDTVSDYVAAAMVACPRCRAAIGSPCRVRKCRNGVRGCTYRVCSVLVELPEPHLERTVKARQEVSR